MAHPFKSAAAGKGRSKFKALSGKKGSFEGDTDGSSLKPAHKRLAELGPVKGNHASSRIDKRARGGRTKSKININIISMPHGREQAGPPPLPPAGPMGVAPAPGPLPFPGAGAPPARARGGKLVKMTGGAEGGLGRLQKARNAKVMRGG